MVNQKAGIMLRSRFRAAAVAGALAVGLAASVAGIVPAGAVVRVTPQAANTCPTFSGSEPIYHGNPSKGTLVRGGTIPKGASWDSVSDPVDGWIDGIAKPGGTGWIALDELEDLGAPFVACI